jgi:hypothetical protein
MARPKGLADYQAPLLDPAPAPTAAPVGELVNLAVLVTRDDHTRLKILATRECTSLQQLGLEAWSLLLKSRREEPLRKVAASSTDQRRRRRTSP